MMNESIDAIILFIADLHATKLEIPDRKKYSGRKYLTEPQLKL